MSAREVLDNATISRLANLKAMFSYANSLLIGGATPLHGAIALLLMDSALEVLFKQVLNRKRVRVGRKAYFIELLDKLDHALTGYELPIEALRRLHEARNNFQHRV